MDEKMPIENKMPDAHNDKKNEIEVDERTAEDILREIEKKDKEWVKEKMGNQNDRDARA